MTTKLPFLAIVLLAVVLISVLVQIPYYLSLSTEGNSDFWSLPSDLSETVDNTNSNSNSNGFSSGSLDFDYEKSDLTESETETISNTPLPLYVLPASVSASVSAPVSNQTTSTPLSVLQTTPHCYNTSDSYYCCAESWEHDLDEWWQDRPDWDVSLETNDTYCFSPIQDQERAHLLKNQVYPLQWQGSCHNGTTSAFRVINSGYSANLGLLGRAFLTAVQTNKTFLESKRLESFLWRYADQDGNGTCPSRDMDCYFLPISRCKAYIGQSDGFDGNLVKKNGGNFGKQITWLRSYLVRPKLWLRRRVFELLSEVQLPTPPCTVIHVRRTDVVLEENWKKKRHYFRIADYLKHVEEGHSVLLLTDDQTAIDEMLEFHAQERNWTYLERKRWRGPEGGMNGHLPSGDAVEEVAYILSEQKLASACQKLVHTRSGFANILYQAMQTRQWGVERAKIDWGKQPNETHFEDATQFFAKLHAERNGTASNSSANS